MIKIINRILLISNAFMGFVPGGFLAYETYYFLNWPTFINKVGLLFPLAFGVVLIDLLLLKFKKLDAPIISFAISFVLFFIFFYARISYINAYGN